MKRFLNWKVIVILIVTLGLMLFSLPTTVQSKIPFLPESFVNSRVHLGLDLQGGSQLDYKIDLRKVPEADRENIIDGVLEVIERRVNGLGVAEPNIYTSAIGEETHIVVELAENANLTQEDVDTYLGKDKLVANLTDDEKKTVSLEKAKATVGKTIQLEFKEQKESIDPAEADKIEENAQNALNRIKAGENYEVVGQEESQAYPGKVKYTKSEYVFESDLPGKLKDTIIGLEAGEFANELIEDGGSFTIDASTGQAVEQKALTIIKLIDISEDVKNEKEIFVSHILIGYTGSDAEPTEERTEEEAYELAKTIKQKLDNGDDFSVLAQENSDDASNKEQGGKLEKPVTGDGTYVYDFEQAALKFTETGQISDIVKTQFGYHILKANEVKANVTEKQYQYETISYSLVPDPWKDTGLTGEHFVHADVQLDNFYQPYVSIQFNDEGAKLFEEITGRNINKPVAIFVGGDLISAPRVNEKISGGSAQISGQFTNDEAKELARDLNTGAIPAPIVLTSEYTIGATLGQEALNRSLLAGFIGMILLMIFMGVYYRVPGLLANIALVAYAVIFLSLLKSQLHIGAALLISLAIFGYLIVKILNNKDSGWEKFLSFILSCAGFFFLAYLLKTGVVLTLAGVAGIILSIGMAVDANVLIFERFKEEMRSGKTYIAALETGFDRAWSAIRDSNFSTLLICAILFAFGSSIIKGFAFTLAAGVLVSMFTAITITRTLMHSLVGKKIAQNEKALGLQIAKKTPHFEFLKSSSKMLIISATLLAITLISLFTIGPKLGLDFTGGTLLEFKFNEPVNRDQLASELNKIGQEINTGQLETLPTDETAEATEEESLIIADSNSDEKILKEDLSTSVDLSTAQIINSGENNYIVKTKYLSSEAHDQIIAKMTERLPEFSEPRFTTIGPTIGRSTLSAAMKAVAVALIIIIIYVAFAFRKVPKEVSPWRFGATAIVALAHDVLIVTGLFIFLGKFLNVEMDSMFITAMLTVLGYSVNDTIIIFDRIRENLINAKREESLEQVVDKALNETLSRSINTTLTTVITLVCVLLFGSSSIFYFTLALTVGIIIGAYSSIYIASPVLVKWTKWAALKAEAKGK